jgi:acyl-CoA reductase-like NAD-dependent aldehyde dehydrogenase
MTAKVQLISPVDGRVYVEREMADATQVEQAVTAAASAQASWQRRSLSERAAYCNAAVDAMLSMQADIVPELAWQMGRPVRFGASELRGFADRAQHMIAIAPHVLAAVEPEPVAGFRRYIKREPLGTVLVVAPWNYP